METKILFLQVASILQSIAIIVLAFTVSRYRGVLLFLHKVLDTFVQDIYYVLFFKLSSALVFINSNFK